MVYMVPSHVGVHSGAQLPWQTIIGSGLAILQHDLVAE